MELKRYRTVLIISMLFAMLFLIMGVILGFTGDGSFLAITPFDNMGLDVLTLWVMGYISPFIGAILPGYILSPILL